MGLKLRKLAIGLMVCLGGLGPVILGSNVAVAQVATSQQVPLINQIVVRGNVRIEPSTIAAYLRLRRGEPFDLAKMDESLKTMIATGIFSDVRLYQDGNDLVVQVIENPIINRIIFEGNKKLDNEDLGEEVRLRPRQFYTRSKVRADVQRIMELYRNKGRFAAIIEPKAVQREQNRVDLIFEIEEGPKTKVGKINVIGNHIFSDGDIRDTMATNESRWWRLFASNDTFDPDRMAFDQQELRNFYLNEGYADFRIISAVAELTPDRNQFILTYSVEEGEQYTFGEVTVESEIRDITPEMFRGFVRIREGFIYSAEAIDNSKEALVNAAGLLGYAFAEVAPQLSRNRETRTIDIIFRVLEAPRAYVERINIRGNVRTLDRVVRREFRLHEGDSFSSALEARSKQRIEQLSFFREVEVTRAEGSTPDRIVLDVQVEEQATGEFNLGLGFSSIENFILDLSLAERNFMGKGQTARLGLKTSALQQQISLSFTEPYFMGRNVAAGADVFYVRTDNNGNRTSFFTSDSKGFSLRTGLALSEYWSLRNNYTLRFDNISLDENFIDTSLGLSVWTDLNGDFRQQDNEFSRSDNYDVLAVNIDTDGDGILTKAEKVLAFSPDFARRSGDFTQSIIGYELSYETRNSFITPTRGRGFRFSQAFAGVGGNVRYLKNRFNFDQYYTPFTGWTLRLAAEGGYILGIGQDIRVNDRFFLGGPTMRGFTTSGVGPRDTGAGGRALGGNAYYVARTELFIPLGDAALESGIRASAFIDAGALWINEEGTKCNPDLRFGCVRGDSKVPRVSVGIGFSWLSPFGPFRIDLAKTIKKHPVDDTQSLQFNVGTVF